MTKLVTYGSVGAAGASPPPTRHADEGLTAMQAGNSPAMIHTHYKGLATKKEAEAWFALAPAQPGNVIQLGSQPKRQAP